ncbi:MAG: multicopper oxidase family protein [Rhodospirillales bacterium]|nr:multicopper oxidase family protein [Rhodospirillales bacterium]
MTSFGSHTSRRSFLAGAGSAALTTLASSRAHGSVPALHEFRFLAAPGRARLTGDERPDTNVWCYSGRVPGPEIRVKQGDRLRVVVENGLAEETTVHWHGIRLPNAMDGVPHLTQPPIQPGGRFVYAFDLPDAGTYWYHPHARAFEQVGRGLFGALIVEEPGPPAFDRDLTWMLGDWRLTPSAEISADFGNFMDMSHAGRLGNTVTVNGRVPEPFRVRSGERIRLRLINATNARIFALGFKGHRPRVIALDGQPVEPHAPDAGRILIGPAARADLALDMEGQPGESFAVVETFYTGAPIKLLDIRYAEGARVRESPPADDVRLPANRLPEPDLAAAERHEVLLGGGMMGGMQSATVDGHTMPMRDMMRRGLAWAINGVAATDHAHAPMLTLARGRSCVLDLRNETAWPHPMHLHGHAFRVISRNGAPAPRREWLDTVLIQPKERAEIAFVADNPGDWMFHCHILEHQAGGMSTVIRVS